MNDDLHQIADEIDTAACIARDACIQSAEPVVAWNICR